MRKRIRLTGRRQLPRSCVEAKLVELGAGHYVVLKVAKRQVFGKFPPNARVKLRLFENKVSETLEFDTLGAMQNRVELRTRTFAAPSCQLRVVGADAENEGRLLGSTNTWTMRADSDDADGKDSESMLLFQPHDIAPLCWKLEIRDDDYPILYIDRSIPQSKSWARNDPVFVSCVLPAVIRELFDDILVEGPPECQWVKDWLGWAEQLMPGEKRPQPGDRSERQKWIDKLLDAFCKNHGTLDQLVGTLKQEAGA